MLAIFFLLIFAGWEFIKFAKWGYKVMRGE